VQPEVVQAQAYLLPRLRVVVVVGVARRRSGASRLCFVRRRRRGRRLGRRRRRAYGQVEVDAAAVLVAVAAAAVAACCVGRAAGAAGGEVVVAGDGGGGIERAVRERVEAAGEELALDVGVPVVLDLVVRPPRQPPGDQRPLVAEELVELDDELVFLVGEVAALEVGAEVVDPPEAAALPATQQPYYHVSQTQ
jgi:hypothetical protein